MYINPGVEEAHSEEALAVHTGAKENHPETGTHLWGMMRDSAEKYKGQRTFIWGLQFGAGDKRKEHIFNGNNLWGSVTALYSRWRSFVSKKAYSEREEDKDYSTSGN